MKIINSRKEENFPEIITLCGSTRFKTQFFEIQRKLTLEGKIVLLPGVFAHADNEQISIAEKNNLDELNLRRIDLSDSILVMDIHEYIGESTKKEITYAKSKGITIQYYSQM